MSSINNQLNKSTPEKVELENQFIIRFPEDLSDVLMDAMKMGNVNEVLTINMEEDMRYGEVRVKDHVLYAKLVDLPTVIESYKTTDNTNLYKTADICQMLVCSRNQPSETDKKRLMLARKIMELEQKSRFENDSEEDIENILRRKRGRPPSKNPRGRPRKSQSGQRGGQLENQLIGRAGQDKEDNGSVSPNDYVNREYLKLDDKFLWPHGLTPPLRNLRRRRLGYSKKGKGGKSPEPDTLRDVKYLLRMDNEAVRVEYEVVDPGEKINQLSDSSSEIDDTLEDQPAV